MFFFISQFPPPRVKSSAPLGSAAEALSPHTPRVRGLQPAHFGSAAELYAARNRIFGTAVPVFDDDGVTPLRTGARFLTRATIGHTIASYYPRLTTPMSRPQRAVMAWPEEDARLEKLANLRRRGKGPPKKGQGKRQQKKKR
eukprot:TRINITY_DN9503_c0_g1_i1.p1 TRINITY_DN9503_c0_g1~~TRINITY_DN9503_c0_g1_i1.p1  ORF type:complete len:159 (+),score=67.70 TRINITY_DN9503_c0_g1_i1:52-477(+)